MPVDEGWDGLQVEPNHVYVIAPNTDIGPPYNRGTGSVQFIGPVSLQQVVGVTIPIDTAHIYVLAPLAIVAQTNPQIAAHSRPLRTPEQNNKRPGKTFT